MPHVVNRRGLKQTLSDWVEVDVTCGQPVCSMCKAAAAKHLHADTPSVGEASEQTLRARAAFSRYIDVRREDGWTDEQLAGLRNAARAVMTWDDDRLMALYQPGLFGSAEEIRTSFVEFWESV